MAGESKLEKWAVGRILANGGETRKLRWLCRRGAPDRLVWLPGWVFPELWEFKNINKPLKEHQTREHKRLMRTGIVCRKIDNRKQVLRLLT